MKGDQYEKAFKPAVPSVCYSWCRDCNTGPYLGGHIDLLFGLLCVFLCNLSAGKLDSGYQFSKYQKQSCI